MYCKLAKQNKTYRRPRLVVHPLKLSLKAHLAHGTQAKTVLKAFLNDKTLLEMSEIFLLHVNSSSEEFTYPHKDIRIIFLYKNYL